MLLGPVAALLMAIVAAAPQLGVAAFRRRTLGIYGIEVCVMMLYIVRMH